MQLRRGGSKSSEKKIDQLNDAQVQKLLNEMVGVIDRDSLTDSALFLLRLVPDGYMPLPHQVGGRRHFEGKLGMYNNACEELNTVCA